jgi:type I restriction enzyme S subunit
MIGTIGLLYFVLDQDINFAIKNIGLFKASKNLDYAEYIFLFLSSDYGKTYFRTRLAGTTQSYLTLSSLREMHLIIPDKATLLGFKRIAKSLFEKFHANNQQTQTLTKTRDVLLPKLMSGKLRITE